MVSVTQHVPSECSISRLPTALLAAILQHVPQRQRLQQCALINSTWAAAAAAATTSIDLTAKYDAQLPPLQSWIRQYGSQLTSLVVKLNTYLDFTSTYYRWQATSSAHPQHLKLMLPCVELSQLTVLHLSGVQLDQLLPTAAESASDRALASSGTASSMPNGQRLPTAPGQDLPLGQGSSAGPAAPLQLLPCLQKLSIKDCLISTADSLTQFSVARSLTSLTIDNLQLPRTEQQQEEEQEQQQEEDEERQQQWQQLGHVLDAVLRCFTQLKQLKAIDLPSVVTAVGLEGAVGSLTELYVQPDWQDGTESCLPARLPQLTALQDLCVFFGDCYPSVLADLRSLDRLRLEHCTISADLKLGSAASTAVQGNAGQPNTLVCALSHLTGVIDLSLHECYHGFLQQQPEQFSALTACADVARIYIRQNDEALLPDGALRHMFPPGLQLSALRSVTLEVHLEQTTDLARLRFMDANELGYLISACPALTHLAICNALTDPTGVMVLQGLPQSCKSLSIGGVVFDDDSSMFIAELTQLTNLMWSYSPELQDTGLERLTVLTALMEFSGTGLPGVSQDMFPRDDPEDGFGISGNICMVGGSIEVKSDCVGCCRAQHSMHESGNISVLSLLLVCVLTYDCADDVRFTSYVWYSPKLCHLLVLLRLRAAADVPTSSLGEAC